MTRIRVYFCCLIMVTFSVSTHAFDDKTRVAFYYGDNPPFQELQAYNVVVVHPHSRISAKEYDTSSSQLYAYVSVGELDPDDAYAKQTDPSWRVGKNKAWDSRVMDLSNPGWRDFLINQVFTPLWDKGYRGFFLDTLDSWQLLNLSPEKNKEQLAGLIDVVKKLKEKYPDAKIITNRGFEVLDAIHQDINAVAAESIYAGWNNNTKTYVKVSESDREWLLGQLNKAHQSYGLPIIGIDYVPPNQRAEAQKIAAKISALGFIPWVSDPYLGTLGVGAVEIIPRKILLLYNEPPKNNDFSSIVVFNASAFFLQYMGFVPILQFVDESLPEETLKGRYAGIITWFNTPVIKNHLLLEKWITKQVNDGVPVLFMQNFGIPLTSPLFKRLNIKFDTRSAPPKEVRISYQDKIMGYEILPKPNTLDFQPTQSDGKILLKLTASNNQTEDVVAITSWGGYALEPFHIVSLPDSHARWVVNPFEFFKQGLRLPEIPVPDITTQNGRRILLAQIDGDAFISRVPWKGDKYAGEVILEEILAHYKIPTTVSIVQREFDLIKESPELQARLIKVAQQMFALPWIAIASHTYSHPLQWGHLREGEPNTPFLSYPDKNYSFSYQKEIVDSSEFINKTLAPPDKKVTSVFWSGDANVQDKPLAVAYQAGLTNINGMSKIYDNTWNSISDLGPFGMYKGKYFHVYSPISNEFEYTDHWSKPLYAFEKVIQTFELTEKPNRYKPISIYYHFYSAADQAALRGLKRVYDWAETQYVTPLQVKDYINKVLDFNNTVIAKYDDGSWLITNNNSLREFRWAMARGFPELLNSKNVIGFNTVNSDIYIHLGNKSESRFGFTQTAPDKPYLVDANAEVTQWDVLDKTIRFSLQGYVPLRFKLANLEHCQLQQNNQLIPSTTDNTYYIKGITKGTFEIQCTE
jgi:polysaccharide biosynthesis protein PelA